MNEPIEVTAINLDERAATFSDQSTGHISDMFDIDGEDTSDPESAVAVIVVHPVSGRFFVELPDDYVPGLVQ